MKYLRFIRTAMPDAPPSSPWVISDVLEEKIVKSSLPLLGTCNQIVNIIQSKYTLDCLGCVCLNARVFTWLTAGCMGGGIGGYTALIPLQIWIETWPILWWDSYECNSKQKPMAIHQTTGKKLTWWWWRKVYLWKQKKKQRTNYISHITWTISGILASG